MPPALQASRGTVRASGNFNASADAEALQKAMKGLGKVPSRCESLAPLLDLQLLVQQPVTPPAY